MFKTAFLAATVLPLGSEALFLYLISSKDINIFTLITAASIGNSLGSLTTYLLGYFLPFQKALKKLSININTFKKVDNYLSNSGGIWSFFCWLPVIGDVIAFYFGVRKYEPKIFIFWMSLGKTVRYIVLWLIFSFY